MLIFSYMVLSWQQYTFTKRSLYYISSSHSEIFAGRCISVSVSNAHLVIKCHALLLQQSSPSFFLLISREVWETSWAISFPTADFFNSVILLASSATHILFPTDIIHVFKKIMRCKIKIRLFVHVALVSCVLALPSEKVSETNETAPVRDGKGIFDLASGWRGKLSNLFSFKQQQRKDSAAAVQDYPEEAKQGDKDREGRCEFIVCELISSSLLLLFFFTQSIVTFIQNSARILIVKIFFCILSFGIKIISWKKFFSLWFGRDHSC